MTRICSTCRFWSQWLEHAGDCISYAVKRQDAMIQADDLAAFNAQWPQKSARCTDPEETCAEWEAPDR